MFYEFCKNINASLRIVVFVPLVYEIKIILFCRKHILWLTLLTHCLVKLYKKKNNFSIFFPQNLNDNLIKRACGKRMFSGRCGGEIVGDVLTLSSCLVPFLLYWWFCMFSLKSQNCTGSFYEIFSVKTFPKLVFTKILLHKTVWFVLRMIFRKKISKVSFTEVCLYVLFRFMEVFR